MKKHRKRKNYNLRRKYEYNLPKDKNNVLVDSVVYGHLSSIQDGIICKNAEEIKTQAYKLCNQLKATTPAQYLTNNFEIFCGLFAISYTAAYLDKQERFKYDVVLYQMEVERIAAQGGYEAAFRIMRPQVADLLQKQLVEVG